MIDEYLAKVKEISKNTSPFAGILGFGNNPSKDSCHGEFYENVAREIGKYQGQEYEIVKFLISADRRTDCSDTARLTLTALQSLAIPLVRRLSNEQRKEIANWYKDNVPKRTWLPVQKDLYKELSRI